MQDFRFPPRCIWRLRSSGLLTHCKFNLRCFKYSHANHTARRIRMKDVRNIQHINIYFALKTGAPDHLENLVTTKHLSHPITTYSSNQTKNLLVEPKDTERCAHYYQVFRSTQPLHLFLQTVLFNNHFLTLLPTLINLMNYISFSSSF
jgi:hypothetical protein